MEQEIKPDYETAFWELLNQVVDSCWLMQSGGERKIIDGAFQLASELNPKLMARKAKMIANRIAAQHITGYTRELGYERAISLLNKVIELTVLREEPTVVAQKPTLGGIEGDGT